MSAELTPKLTARGSFSKRLSLVLLVGLAGAALYMIWPPASRAQYNQVFFSDNDGESVYVDNVFNIPPFSHDGKTAVRAEVFMDPSGKQFVGYLRRYNTQWKQICESALADVAKRGRPPESSGIFFDRGINSGTEVKRPGKDNPWVPLLSEEGKKVTNVVGPGNSKAVQVVIPNADS